MGKRKAGLLARAVTCLAVMASVAFGAPTFAEAAPPMIGEIRVTVPTEIDCCLMPDGSVVAPTNLSVANVSDCQDVVMDVYTADSYGHAVDFTLDADGKRVLDRSEGRDKSAWIDLHAPSQAQLDLNVTELARQSNAALMDAASVGKTDMFKLGFKFNLKELRESVAIAGDPSVGSTLTANVMGAQEDAQFAYQWYRVQKTIPICEDVVVEEDGTYKSNSFIIPDDVNIRLHITFDSKNYFRMGNLYLLNASGEIYSYDYIIRPSFNSTTEYVCDFPMILGEFSNPFTLKLECFNDDGDGRVEVMDIDTAWIEVIGNPEPYPIDGATGKTYTTTSTDADAELICKVTDASGKYKGTLTSDPFGPISNLPKTAFAVYSADDQSLDFYKRTKVPAVGETFEGKTVTNVYTGIEDGKITPAVNLLAPEVPNNSPFTEADRIASVSFVDRISAPSVINSWFRGFSACTSGDFRKLDTCKVKNMFGLFSRSGFTDLDLSSWDTSNVDVFGQAFSYCGNLKSLDIGSWACKSTADSYLAFFNCPSLRQVTVGGSIGQLIHELPTHDSGGMWYNKSGIGFHPVDIPTDVADTYTYRSTPPEPPKFTGTVTFSPQAEVAEDRQSTTINISYTYSPRDAVAGIVKYEVADDANGLNAREVAIDKNVLQEPVWGKYMRITIADTSGKYEGSVDSGWIGRLATEFYGRAEITDTPQQGTRPGYRVTGPILVDGQSDLSCYDIRWEIADDATGLNARPHDELNAGRYLKTEDIGKYVRIVVSAKAPYSVHVPGSIASDWVEVRGHNGGDIMRADSSMVEQDDAVGKVLISSKGEAVDE